MVVVGEKLKRQRFISRIASFLGVIHPGQLIKQEVGWYVFKVILNIFFVEMMIVKLLDGVEFKQKSWDGSMR